jgi:DNA-binding CsgD family transcriptional regulator
MEGAKPDGRGTGAGAGSGGRRRRNAKTGPLSNREREVLELLAEGLSGAEIAEKLFLSPETVRTHIRNAMAKLGASTRSHAVALALTQREIAPQSTLATGPGGNGGEAEGTDRARERVDPGPLEVPLASVLEGLVSLWDVDGGSIYLVNEDGLALRRIAHVSPPERSGAPTSLGLGEGTVGRVALERRAQVLQSATGETGAVIAAPMLSSGRLIGVVALATRPSRPTGRQELLLLQALSARLGEVIADGGERTAVRLADALEGFRSSWSSATRAL